MSPMSPGQLRTRRRVESVVRIMAPALNIVLAVGERVSRLVEPEDHGYYPPRTSNGAPPPPSRPEPPPR